MIFLSWLIPFHQARVSTVCWDSIFCEDKYCNSISDKEPSP